MSCGEVLIVTTFPANSWQGAIKEGLRLEALFANGLMIRSTWPRSAPLQAPAHVSDHVARAYVQAEDNLRRGHTDASTAMSRKAIALALADLQQVADIGHLRPAIKKYVDSGGLPAAMGDWANTIAVFGNAGAHDKDAPSEEEAVAALSFTRFFLQYAFTLPKELALARANPTKDATS